VRAGDLQKNKRSAWGASQGEGSPRLGCRGREGEEPEAPRHREQMGCVKTWMETPQDRRVMREKKNGGVVRVRGG